MTTDQIKAIALAATVSNQVLKDRQFNPPSVNKAATDLLQALIERGDHHEAYKQLYILNQFVVSNGQYTLAERIQDAQYLLTSFPEPALA